MHPDKVKTPVDLRVPAAVPHFMQVNPLLACSSPAPRPITPQEALAKLQAVAQLMYGAPLDPLNLTPDQQSELADLQAGGTVVGTIAQTGYNVQFRELVLKVAARAAADFCFNMLGMENIPGVESAKQGYVCMFLTAYRQCSQTDQFALNFGWIIPSLTTSDVFQTVNPDCNRLPVPNHPPVYPTPCP